MHILASCCWLVGLFGLLGSCFWLLHLVRPKHWPMPPQLVHATRQDRLHAVLLLAKAANSEPAVRQKLRQAASFTLLALWQNRQLRGSLALVTVSLGLIVGAGYLGPSPVPTASAETSKSLDALRASVH